MPNARFLKWKDDKSMFYDGFEITVEDIGDSQYNDFVIYGYVDGERVAWGDSLMYGDVKGRVRSLNLQKGETLYVQAHGKGTPWTLDKRDNGAGGGTYRREDDRQEAASAASEIVDLLVARKRRCVKLAREATGFSDEKAIQAAAAELAIGSDKEGVPLGYWRTWVHSEQAQEPVTDGDIEW